ncbi:hypothetical protein [Nocardiopsis potens]|uniref:hypothetical protein n=1 Tax=Nocardiopsis potens TaxID=1246458 RepID=UPI00036AF4ED|nr:hypothetical protein [Nocardiopsis potens]
MGTVHMEQETAGHEREARVLRERALLEEMRSLSPGEARAMLRLLHRTVEKRTEEEEERARKVSVSMPESLVDAVRERAGRGEFSRYISEAVATRLERERLIELNLLLEEEYGPVSEEYLAEAEAAWPDAD